MSNKNNTTAFAGCLAVILAPLLITFAVLPGAFVWSWTWFLCYNLLIQPTLFELGFNPIDVSYWVWFVAYISVGVFKGPFSRIKNKTDDWSEIVSGLGTRIINGLFLALVIWVVSVIVF